MQEGFRSISQKMIIERNLASCSISVNQRFQKVSFTWNKKGRAEL